MMRRARLLAIATAATCALMTCRHARDVEGDEKGGDREGTANRKVERGGSSEASSTRVPPRAGHPAVAATPEGFMQPGSVREIQEALRARGLLENSTGRLDEATSAALRRFQSSQQLAATGAPDRETVQRLGLDVERIYRTVPRGGEPSRP